MLFLANQSINFAVSNLYVLHFIFFMNQILVQQEVLNNGECLCHHKN